MNAAVKIAILGLLAVTMPSTAVLAQGKGRLAACKPEIDKFCASEPRGQGKIRACLQANSDKLSDDCKAALDNASH
jgi:hypothetical protein